MTFEAVTQGYWKWHDLISALLLISGL